MRARVSVVILLALIGCASSKSHGAVTPPTSGLATASVPALRAAQLLERTVDVHSITMRIYGNGTAANGDAIDDASSRDLDLDHGIGSGGENFPTGFYSWWRDGARAWRQDRTTTPLLALDPNSAEYPAPVVRSSIAGPFTPLLAARHAHGTGGPLSMHYEFDLPTRHSHEDLRLALSEADPFMAARFPEHVAIRTAAGSVDIADGRILSMRVQLNTATGNSESVQIVLSKVDDTTPDPRPSG